MKRATLRRNILKIKRLGAVMVYSLVGFILLMTVCMTFFAVITQDLSAGMVDSDRAVTVSELMHVGYR
ncbi:MAG: hypothetical protein IJ523_01670 [Succinivibrionaceae bacterium]|nr:hypothetical protein [Succinivibrionaceae bacterium]